MTDRVFGFVGVPEPGGRRGTKGKQCERSRYYLKTERTKELTPATDQRKANIHRNKTLKKTGPTENQIRRSVERRQRHFVSRTLHGFSEKTVVM